MVIIQFSPSIMKQLKQMNIIVILFVIKLSSQAITYPCSQTVIGIGTCAATCSVCIDGLCQSCCPNYYWSPYVCNICTDNYCRYCQGSGASQTCDSCYYSNWSPMTSNPAICQICNTATAFNCRTINGCSASNACSSCSNYAINTNQQCLTCFQIYRNCATCNNNQCLTCNYPYVLNYTSLSLQCVTCVIPNCNSCYNGPQCSNCISGYYVSSGRCALCVYPCITCYSITFCLSCNNITQQYQYLSYSCNPCSYWTFSCKTCTDQTTSFSCLTCMPGYFLASSTQCSVCVSPCANCSSSTTCLSCIDSSYTLSSGQCIQCSSTMPNCIDCTSSTTCTRCPIGYVVSTTGCDLCTSLYPDCAECSTVSCTACASSFIQLTDLSCVSVSCTSPCVTCSNDTTYCYSCLDGYYVSLPTCLPCTDPLCLKCTDASTCIECSYGLLLSAGGCVECPGGQQYNPFIGACEICPANCLFCKWGQGCYNCSALYEITLIKGLNLCKEICGDTYAIDLPCDLGLQANDGCSDTCTIQSGYTCTKTPTTTTLANGTSIATFNTNCSFLGSISISVIAAKQSLFSNTMTLVFSIQPYLYGLPTNADTQDYIKSIYSLSPFDPASYSISIDDAAQTITFQVEHSTDISDSSFSMGINFAYLSGVSSMFQNLTNTSYVSTLKQVLPQGRLGQSQSQSEYTTCKIVYNWALVLNVCVVLIMIVGIFGKELVGLEQAFICQTVFLLLCFKQQKLTLPLLALSGFKYSTGFGFDGSNNYLKDHQSYLLNINVNSFTYNFNFNLAAYILPLLVSLIILIYKLKYKHLIAKRDLAQQLYQVIMGETILYMALFNFSGLAIFSFLFYRYSFDGRQFYSNLFIFTGTLVTIFALFNFVAKPEIVGIFRSALKSQSEYRESRVSKLWQRFSKCISRRPCEQKYSEGYSKFSVNFYSIMISYLIVYPLLVIYCPFGAAFISISIHLLLFAIVSIVRPYYNPLQKLRSLLTYFLLLLANFVNIGSNLTFTLPLIFLFLLSIHMVLSVVIMIMSLRDLIKRKCNDRTEVVKKMFREAEDTNIQNIGQTEKQALREIISRYQFLNSNLSIEQALKNNNNQDIQKQELLSSQPLVKRNSQELNLPSVDQEVVPVEPSDKMDPLLISNEVDQDLANFQEEIIMEENEHLRYQKGLEFFDKYEKKIDNELVHNHYLQI